MEQPSFLFGLFTDPHYARRTPSIRRDYPGSLSRVERCLGIFKQVGVDFVVCLGDLVDHPDDSAAGREELLELARGISEANLPFHLVLGNHDVDTLSKEMLASLCSSAHSSYYSFDHKGYHFAILDTNFDKTGAPYLSKNSIWDEAYLGATQAEWLRQDLASHSGQPAVILTHANLDLFFQEGIPDPHVVRDVEIIREILESHSAPVTVFQGHYHPGRESVHNGISYHTLPALVEQKEGTYCLLVEADSSGITYTVRRS